MCRQDATFSIDSKIEHEGGVFVAFRVTKGGCHTVQAEGVYFWVNSNGTYEVTSDIGKICNSTKCFIFTDLDFYLEVSELVVWALGLS